MPLQSAELAVVLGFAVSLGLQLLKRIWPQLNATDALVKQIVAVLLAAGAVLAAAQWQVNEATLWQAVLAGIAALGTHRALLATPAPCEKTPLKGE